MTHATHRFSSRVVDAAFLLCGTLIGLFLPAMITGETMPASGYPAPQQIRNPGDSSDQDREGAGPSDILSTIASARDGKLQPRDQQEFYYDLQSRLNQDPIDVLNALDDAGALNLIRAEDILAACSAYVKADAAALMGLASRLHNPGIRITVQLHAIESAAVKDLGEGMQLLQHVAECFRTRAREHLGRAITESGGVEGLTRILASASVDQTVFEGALQGLMVKGSEYALEALRAADFSDSAMTKERAIRTLLHLGDLPAGVTLKLAADLPTSRFRSSKLRDATAQLLAESPGSVDDLVKSNDSDAETAAILASASQMLAGKDPQGAIKAINAINSEGLRSATAAKILGSRFYSDPVKGIAWARGLDDPVTQSHAISSVAKRWARETPVSFLEYVFNEASDIDAQHLIDVAASVLDDHDEAVGGVRIPLSSANRETAQRLHETTSSQRVKRVLTRLIHQR
jgi:hypothetical protein